MTEIGESVSSIVAYLEQLEETQQANPCDIDKLILEVTGQDDDKTKSLKIEIDKPRRSELVADVKSREILRLLRRYDMIIDCLADPHSAAKSKPAKIGGKASYVGLKCASSSHASLVLLDHLEADSPTVEQQANAASVAIAPAKFYTPKTFFDQLDINRKGSFDSVFSLIRGMITSVCGDLHCVELQATSCGVRAKGDGKKANARLVGLVRVIPRSKWAIGIKIPPLGSHSYSRETGNDFGGTAYSSRSVETSSRFNRSSSSTSTKTSGEGVLGTYDYKHEKQVGGEVDSYEFSRSVKDGEVTKTFEEKHSKSDGQSMKNVDGTITQKEIKERLSRAYGFDIVITHNDTEVECGAQIEKIKKTISAICKAITDIKQLFNKLPQIGWKFAFEVSVLAGSITLELATRYVDGAKAGGRYLATEYKLAGSIELKILDVSLSLSFGVDIRALESGIVAKVEGKLSVEASISKDIDMGFFAPRQELAAKASTTAKLSIVGSVSLLGKTLADAELSVSTGLELDDAKLIIELGSSSMFDLKGKLKMKPVQLTGFIRSPYWFDSKIDPPVKIVDGADPICTFS